MDKNYLYNLDRIYRDQSNEIRKKIKSTVLKEFKPEIDSAKTANSKSLVWNNNWNKMVGYYFEKKNTENTIKANEAKMEQLNDKIKTEVQKRSAVHQKKLGEIIFQDFGGSRKEAFKQLDEHEAKQKEAIRGKAKNTFQKNVGETVVEKKKKLEVIRNKAENHFKQVSQKLEQSKPISRDVSKNERTESNEQKVNLLDNKKIARDRAQTDVEIQILKTGKSEEEIKSLDPKFWEKVKQVEYKSESSRYITTSKPEASYEDKMRARIKDSFNRSAENEKSL